MNATTVMRVPVFAGLVSLATIVMLTWNEAEVLESTVKRLIAEARYTEALKPAARLRAIAVSGRHTGTGRSGRAARYLCEIQQRLGDRAEAEPVCREALSLLDRSGRGVLDAAAVLRSLAFLASTGPAERDNSESLFRESLELSDRFNNGENEESAQTRHSWATAIVNAGGHLDRASAFIDGALATRKRLFGATDPRYGSSLLMRAAIHMESNEFGTAGDLLQQNLAIQATAAGFRMTPLLAMAHEGLASLYLMKGDPRRAIPELKWALRVRERLPGVPAAVMSGNLLKLGQAYTQTGEYRTAKDYLTRARDVHSNPETLDALGLVYLELGQFEDAKNAFKESIGMLSGVGTLQELCGPLHNEALLLESQKDYAAAEQNLLRSLALMPKSPEELHPFYPNVMLALGFLKWAAGNPQDGIPFLRAGEDAQEQDVARALSGTSESDKRKSLQTARNIPDMVRSFAVAALPGDAEALRLGLLNVLRRKGRVTDAVASEFSALRNAMMPADRELLTELMTVRRMRADYDPAKRKFRRDDAGLARRQEDLERMISAKYGSRARTVDAISIAAIQNALPRGGVLIEFAEYRPYDPRASAIPSERYGDPVYGAYLLFRDGTVRWIPVADARPLRLQTTKVLYEMQTVSDAALDASRELYRILFEKIDAAVRGSRQLLIAADGPLALVPFGALIDADGKYLAERYDISYLNSGRDLIRIGTGEVSLRPPEIYADPYRPGWTPFPESEEEARYIADLFPASTIYQGPKALESQVKKTVSPMFLHIEAHGKFKRGIQQTADDVCDTTEQSPECYEVDMDALENSVVLLAASKGDANGPAQDGDLTAIEASMLNLSGTQLVVLSVCQSGLGKARPDEVVFGLRRGFQLARARSLVAALWDVDIEPTVFLMKEFYRLLRGAEGTITKSEALRRAQQNTRATNGGRWAHPHYWAAFVLSGDPSPLRGPN